MGGKSDDLLCGLGDVIVAVADLERCHVTSVGVTNILGGNVVSAKWYVDHVGNHALGRRLAG